MSLIFKFIISIATSLFLVFILHISILHLLNLPLFENKIIEAYLINFFMAVVIYYGLFLLKKNYSDQLGFLYMGGSFIKFIVFFLVFYPSYKLGGKINFIEFAAFFTPYAVSLILETLGVIKFLKK